MTTSADLSLASLATLSGLHPRTIRSWITQGLLPGSRTRGRHARYAHETLERTLAVRAMREILGMPLAEIRQSLLVAPPEEIRDLAARAAKLAPESTAPTDVATATSSAGPGDDPGRLALEFLRDIRRQSPSSSLTAGSTRPAATLGFDALERHLNKEGTTYTPDRKTRTEEWLTLRITPDVELSVRGPLDPDQRARLERCGDLIRDILHGRTQ